MLPGTDGLAAIRIDGLRLLLPQSEVAMLESAADLRPVDRRFVETTPVPLACFEARDYLWPVYALDEGLRPEPAVRSTRRVCALLATDTLRFGLVADGFGTHRADRFRWFPLPAAMAGGAELVAELAIMDEHVYCLSSVRRIASCLGEGAAVTVTAAAAESMHA